MLEEKVVFFFEGSKYISFFLFFFKLHIAMVECELEYIKPYRLSMLLAKCTLRVTFFQSALNAGEERKYIQWQACVVFKQMWVKSFQSTMKGLFLFNGKKLMSFNWFVILVYTVVHKNYEPFIRNFYILNPEL